MLKPNRQVQRTHRLLLEAAGRLFSEKGPDEVTHLRVAEEAGVSRATVYRHWPERVDMLTEVLATGNALPSLPASFEGSVRQRVGEALRRTAGPLNSEIGSVVTLLGRAEWDEASRAAKATMVEAGPRRFVRLLEAAAAAGELEAATDPQLLGEVLLGALLARRLIFDEAVTDEFIDALLDRVLPG
jgi:AcrR family transcriptional regulator